MKSEAKIYQNSFEVKITVLLIERLVESFSFVGKVGKKLFFFFNMKLHKEYNSSASCSYILTLLLYL